MAEGSHKAVVELMGRVDSLEKATRTAQKEISRLSLELEKAQRAAGKTSAAADKVESSFDKAANGARKLRDGLAAGTAAVVGTALAVDRAADRLIRYSAVMENAAFSTEKARTATRGLVSDYDLQRFANQAAQLEVAKTSERFAQLTGAVVKLGHAQGRDAVDSIERMVSALGRGETETLDELGVRLKVTDAYREYAKILGVSTDALNDQQKAEAVRVIGSREIIARAQEINDVTNEQAEAVKRASIEVQNFGDDLLVAAGSALAWARNDLKEDFQSIAGGGVELNEELTLAEHNAATMAIAVRQIREEIEALTLANDPMIAAFREGVAIVDDTLSKYKTSLHLIELSNRATRMGERIIKQNRPKGRSGAASSFNKQGEAFEFAPDDIKELQGGKLASGLKGEQDMSLEDSAQAFADKHLEIERNKNEAMLNEKVRALEAQQAASVEPIDQIARYEEALLEHNQFLLDTTSDDAARLALHDQRRQIVHEAQIKRIAAERAAERKKLADLQTWTSVSGQLLGMQTQTATMAAETFIKSDERRAKFVNRARGIEALGIGALQVVQAAAAAASFNVPQAILHSAAAAVAFTQGGLLISGALDQRAGGSAGRMPSMSGGGGMSSTGGGVGGGQRREGLVDQINSDVPPSPNPRAPTTASRKEQGRGGGMTFNGPIHLYGTPEDEWLENLSNAQAKFARNNPEAA
jgi:hypothetical protein